MNIILVQPITDRPIIDAVSPDDFTIIGDASDGNIVKRVLFGTLTAYFIALIADQSTGNTSWESITNKPLEFVPSLHTQSISSVIGLIETLEEKLAIANYSFNTIPDKPDKFTPSVHDQPISTITGLEFRLGEIESRVPSVFFAEEDDFVIETGSILLVIGGILTTTLEDISSIGVAQIITGQGQGVILKQASLTPLVFNGSLVSRVSGGQASAFRYGMSIGENNLIRLVRGESNWMIFAERAIYIYDFITQEIVY